MAEAEPTISLHCPRGGREHRDRAVHPSPKLTRMNSLHVSGRSQYAVGWTVWID